MIFYEIQQKKEKHKKKNNKRGKDTTVFSNLIRMNRCFVRSAVRARSDPARDTDRLAREHLVT